MPGATVIAHVLQGAFSPHVMPTNNEHKKKDVKLFLSNVHLIANVSEVRATINSKKPFLHMYLPLVWH